jgi:hypothetical protein
MSGISQSAVVLDPQRFPLLDLLRPPMQLRLNSDQNPEVADLLRKRWLVLSPEEWVRQHVLFWLLSKTGYPPELLSVERGIRQKKERTDVVGYHRNGSALLLVECKEPRVQLDEKVLMQVMRYNHLLKARFIWLCNGISHQVLEMDAEGNFRGRHAMLPGFGEMSA